MQKLLRETFAALAVPHFRVLWTGTLFALLGFFMSTVVQSVVAFELTGENTSVGLVVFAQGLMMFTLGPLGGAYADRLPKRRVIAICQLTTMAVFFSIAWAIDQERVHMAWLVIGSAIMGSAFAFLGPARQSLAVELVGPDLRGNAIALSQVANSACRVLGPALGGAFLAWFSNGATLAYIAMGVAYLGSVLTLLLLPKSKVHAEAREKHVLQDLLEGWRYVRRTSSLARLLLLFTLVTILGFPHNTILPGFAENELGTSAEASSVLFGVTAFGALLASLMVARLADSPQAPALLVRLAAGFGVSLVVTAWSPNFVTMTLLMVAVGFLAGAFQTLGGSVIVKQTEPRYVGRVMSLTMLSFAGFGLMGLPVGYFADLAGERATFVALGVVVVAAAFGLRSAGNAASPPAAH